MVRHENEAQTEPHERSTEASRIKSLRGTAQRALPVISGATVSLLPVCPACWPAYAAFLSALGLGFLMQTGFLLPLAFVLVVAAVAGLAYRAKTRRGLGPVALGVAASLMFAAAQFGRGNDFLLHLGVGVLVAAGLWNAWPKRTGRINRPGDIPNSQS